MAMGEITHAVRTTPPRSPYKLGGHFHDMAEKKKPSEEAPHDFRTRSGVISKKRSEARSPPQVPDRARNERILMVLICIRLH